MSPQLPGAAIETRPRVVGNFRAARAVNLAPRGWSFGANVTSVWVGGDSNLHWRLTQFDWSLGLELSLSSFQFLQVFRFRWLYAAVGVQSLVRSSNFIAHLSPHPVALVRGAMGEISATPRANLIGLKSLGLLCLSVCLLRALMDDERRPQASEREPP